MRSSVNIFKHLKTSTRNPTSSITNYTRKDLTNKWLSRVQEKATDSGALEAVNKLSSLVGYYTKPAEESKENIDWNFWKQNIRSEGIVDKLHDKLNQAYEKTYNVETLASKSAVNTEKYEKVGLFLKYNHDLWMKHYIDNLDVLFNLHDVGDILKVSETERLSWHPGVSENTAGWRETGYTLRNNVYYEDSFIINIGNQFRYTNTSLQPYYHPVCAWERGLVCKHSLMSL